MFGLLLLSSLCPRPPMAGGEMGPTVEGIVLRVVDGSTLDARVDGNRTVVGYVGAQAPSAGEACGAEALARNRELAGEVVLLEEDPAYGLDDADRRLYYAYTTDGVLIDLVLVFEGLASAARPDARFGEALAYAEADARAARRGCLWANS